MKILLSPITHMLLSLSLYLPLHTMNRTSTDIFNERASFAHINNNFSDVRTHNAKTISARCKKNKFTKDAFDYFTEHIKKNLWSMTAEDLATIEEHNSTTPEALFNKLPLFIRELIHEKAHKRINCKTYFEHKNKNGILCTALSFKQPIAVISSRNVGMIIFDTQAGERIATFEQETPYLLCFNPSGKYVAAVTYNSHTNKSTVRQYNAKKGIMHHAIELNNYCLHIAYNRTTKKRIVTAITSENSITPDKKVIIEFTKDKAHIVGVETSSKLAVNHDQNKNCRNKRSPYCTITPNDANSLKIITEVTISTKTSPYFYQCYKAIENTNNKYHLLKFKSSCSYKNLNSREQNNINVLLIEKRTSLDAIARLNKKNQPLRQIKY